MWRARTEGDDRPSRGAGARSDNGARNGQGRSLGGRAGGEPPDDPRSELTGRKIRRIESGPPGLGDRPAGARPDHRLARRPGTDDDPAIGGRQNGRPGRHIGRPELGGVPDGLGLDDDGDLGLPPLRQPTGEVPQVAASLGDDGGVIDARTGRPEGTGLDWLDDTVNGSVGSGNGVGGVFDDPPSSLSGAMPSALAAAGAGRIDQANGGQPLDDRGEADGGISALARPGRGEADPLADAITDTDQTAAIPSAFPSLDDRQAGDPFPSWSSARHDDTTAVAPARARAGAGPGRLDEPGGLGSPGRAAGRPVAANRLQETEIKLAGRKDPVKPKEPNRVLLGLALALVVLAGAAVAWWLTRDDGTTEAVDDATESADVTTDTTAIEAAPATPEAEAAPADEPLLDVPLLSLVGVEPGPLDPAATYSIDLAGEAPGSLLQVVVDGVPQGEAATVLPDLILPPGRHTLSVNVTNGADVTSSTPVEVYVLGSVPAAGTLANLASVDIVNEGWDEAIRRFDGFRAAGHEGIELLPITPGYWNLFIPDLGDADAVGTYCESFGLAVPDECFPRPFDPSEYQGPSAAPAAPADGGTDTADDGAMTDDDGAMTDGGEAETSTSTTTGG